MTHTIGTMPLDSFGLLFGVQHYKNKHGVVFMACKGESIGKQKIELTKDFSIEPSTKEDFLEAVKAADISSGMSHLYQEGFMKGYMFK